MYRILVVDDDEAANRAIAFMLKTEHFEVVEAHDGAQAMAVLRSQPIDLVLCDIFMPVSDGFETIGNVRRKFPDIPVVAMSGGGALGVFDVLPVARRLGAHETLEKPLSMEKLIAVITQLLGKNTRGNG